MESFGEDGGGKEKKRVADGREEWEVERRAHREKRERGRDEGIRGGREEGGGGRGLLVAQWSGDEREWRWD